MKDVQERELERLAIEIVSLEEDITWIKKSLKEKKHYLKRKKERFERETDKRKKFLGIDS